MFLGFNLLYSYSTRETMNVEGELCEAL